MASNNIDNGFPADEKKASATASSGNLDTTDRSVSVAAAQSELKNVPTTAMLDESELFLQRHGIPRSRLAEILAANDEETDSVLRLRIDWTLMPLLCGTYMLQFIDKQALSSSAVFDLFPSTGITASEYS